MAALQLVFTDADGQDLQRAADQAVELKLTPTRPDMIAGLDQRLIRDAAKELASSGETIHVRQGIR